MLLGILAAAPAEEAPPPLIDIDGTVVLQFVLFLAMLAVVSRVLLRPYWKLREERRRGIQGRREEAKEMEERARKIVIDHDDQLSRAKLRGAEERQRLRAEGAAHERQVLGKARDEAQRATEDARRSVADKAAQARAGLGAQADALALQIASKILGREVA
jgi:F-type H+-transporting ATPase subunit b